MALQVGQLAEGFIAAWVTAFVGFITCVGADVLLQMGELGKFTLAYLAAVGFDAQMNPSVLRQVRGIGEGFGTLRAFVRLSLPHVDLCVELQVCLTSEDLRTHLALVLPGRAIIGRVLTDARRSGRHLGGVDRLRDDKHGGRGDRGRRR